MFLVLGEVLCADVFDFLQFFVVLLIDAIVVLIDLVRGILDECLQLVDLLLRSEFHLIFETLQRHLLRLLGFVLVSHCCVLRFKQVFVKFVDSYGQIFFSLAEVVLSD